MVVGKAERSFGNYNEANTAILDYIWAIKVRL